MDVKNALAPTEAQVRGFLEPGHDGPIYMVNLLRFRDRAEYPDGRASNLSGAEAYAIYGEAVSVLLGDYGGGAMFGARVNRLMLGEVEDLWDQVAIAMYPSRKAMLDMISSERYQEIAVHRTAGLAGQLNIETIAAGGKWLATA